MGIKTPVAKPPHASRWSILDASKRPVASYTEPHTDEIIEAINGHAVLVRALNEAIGGYTEIAGLLVAFRVMNREYILRSAETARDVAHTHLAALRKVLEEKPPAEVRGAMPEKR